MIAPWNYPLITAGNAIIPAVLAGNSVLIKHSPYTPMCADVFQSAFLEAGAPQGLVSSLHADHDTVAQVRRGTACRGTRHPPLQRRGWALCAVRYALCAMHWAIVYTAVRASVCASVPCE